jgi:hypothetical protein
MTTHLDLMKRLASHSPLYLHGVIPLYFTRNPEEQDKGRPTETSAFETVSFRIIQAFFLTYKIAG